MSLIDPNVARSWTLPAEFYTEESVFLSEREKVFARTWQLVGHVRQVARPGDYFTTEVAAEPLLIVRGGDGSVRAFSNVCRHRAGPVAQGCGSRKLFRCMYHGWTYSLDGALLHSTEMDGVEGFRHEHFHLVPLRCEEWFNLIFVNLVAETVEELAKQAERFDFRSMQFFARRTYDMQCNWKTYIDNYLEGFHLPTVHPGLNRELDFNSYTVEPHASYVRQFSPIRGAQAGDETPRRYQEARADLTTDYFWAFPNWMLNCYPDNVQVNIVFPVEAERTLAIFEWYLAEKDLSSAVSEASVRLGDQVQHEDIAICEAVQRNLHSRVYQRGRYSALQEKGVHAFHRMYENAMQKA